MNQLIHGKNLIAVIEVDSTKKSIGCATSHSLQIDVATIDVTHKDLPLHASASEAGQITWSCSCDAFTTKGSDGFDTAKLIELQLDAEPVTLYFAIADPEDDGVPSGGFGVQDSTASGSISYKGKALITSVSISASATEKSTCSISFTGCGALEKV